ncbi:MAG: hypothetical protein ACJAQW_001376 [Paracoccaceae bacterium]|jgi:hypothetical protein
MTMIGILERRVMSVPAICVVVSIAAAGSVRGAEYQCTFAMSCVETKSCQPTGLDVTVSGTTPGGITLSTGGRTIDVTLMLDPSREARAYVSAMEYNTIQLLTIFENGDARYTQHTPIQGLQSMTHHGSCERGF